MKKVFLHKTEHYLQLLAIPPHGYFRMLSFDSSEDNKNLMKELTEKWAGIWDELLNSEDDLINYFINNPSNLDLLYSCFEVKDMGSASSNGLVVELFLQFSEDRLLLVDLDAKTWEVLSAQMEY